MTKERLFIELNKDNCKTVDNKLIITLPYESQSCEGVDFHFNKDFIKDMELRMKSIEFSPAPLVCFWNWMTSPFGNPMYEETLENSVNISKYTQSGIQGAFGFSGHTLDESDMTITITLEK